MNLMTNGQFYWCVRILKRIVKNNDIRAYIMRLVN